MLLIFTTTESVLCFQRSSNPLWLWGFKIDSTLFCVKIKNSEIMKYQYSRYKKPETAQWSLFYTSHKWSKWLYYLLSTHLLMVCYKRRTICHKYYGEWNDKEDTVPVVTSQWGRQMWQIIRICNTQSLHCSGRAVALEVEVVPGIAVTSCTTEHNSEILCNIVP